MSLLVRRNHALKQGREGGTHATLPPSRTNAPRAATARAAVPQINCDTRTEEDAYTGVLTKQHCTSEDLAAALRMRLALVTCVVTFCRERKEGWKHDMRHHVIYQISSIHFKFVLRSALAVQPISIREHYCGGVSSLFFAAAAGEESLLISGDN